ncbi:hypothetical protein LH426_10065 [Laribacter hongkongensis]|uniref:Uncharacterized protein n=1 Tax=Laribacter hongkongensis (strain HLHK9) TaxID=557598 RepID=C1D8C5_LARHH|nr:hypothetical protein [Laribacter hongkongensis]ACO74715.1 hypothetical protein LHK_01730 [Laribacter hongkongensis HLHK9]MCG8998925.1 hypothetical protein [Laribacter hongkongensis]MCG9004829.1 hypothetical protein [Laribacter hongkongensis]MCG9006675.1 hypothetical protein [Laribacter hongkongensis]MCG9012467.1 hypothetical protein [Laribacter hongkongensis]
MNNRELVPLPQDADAPSLDDPAEPTASMSSQSPIRPDAAFLDEVLGMIEGRIAPKGDRFRHARPLKARGRK